MIKADIAGSLMEGAMKCSTHIATHSIASNAPSMRGGGKKSKLLNVLETESLLPVTCI